MFYHALLHSDDEIKKIEEASTKRGRMDEMMFEKLHDRLFHHDEEDHETTTEKVAVDVHDVIDDMFE